VLKQIASLKKKDLAAFETIRNKLKDAGCRVAVLDDAIAKEISDLGPRGRSEVDNLLEIAQAAKLFRAPDKTGYADIEIQGHRETWPIRSKGFSSWLRHRFYEAKKAAPSSEAVQSVLNSIEANAQFDSPEHVVHIRVGGLNDRLYLDLGDETWRAVEIDANGWRIVDKPPVRFRRAPGVLPLPTPVKNGSIQTLKSFLNVRSDCVFRSSVTSDSGIVTG
jgi:hypothetical protein